MNEMPGIKLPNGWHVWPSGKDAFAITCGEGFVSIDFQKRSFELGHTPVFTDRSDTYTGRGWKQRLVDDAIKHFDEVNDPQN